MTRLCKPNWLDVYIQYTTSQQAPERYHKWIGISTIASALGRNVFMDRGYFKLFPNLYTGLVGPTGITKTTAANIGSSMLNDVSKLKPQLCIELMRGRITSYYLYEWFNQVSSAQKDCICSIYAPEMKNFLSELNKTDMVTLLTDFYECPDDPEYRTKGGGSLKFRNVCINLLICTTPEWLITGTSSDEIAGGFTGRFIYIFADTDERSIAFPEDFLTPKIQRIRLDLVTDLMHMATLNGQFVMTDQARAEFILWYDQRKSEWKDERLIGYYARKGTLVLKLCMILSISRSDTLVIDEDILHDSWKLLKQTEEVMGGVFSGLVSDPSLRYKDYVLALLARATNQTMTRVEILRKGWNRFDGIILDRIITNLIDMHVVEQVPTPGMVVYRIRPGRLT